MNDVARASTTQPVFLAGGSELGSLIRAHDWSASPLGPIETWPQSLRTILGFLLRSPIPMVLLWGDDGIMLYNDAYSVFAGGRHPEQLGMKVREGWPEVATFNDNVMRVGLAGGTLAYRDQELTLHRYGRPERVWMNLDYSPVLGESGEPAGVLCILAETTGRVAAEQLRDAAEAALRSERDRCQGVLDNMGEAFVLLDREFRIVDMNTEAMRLEQRPKEAILGKTHEEAHPDAAPEIGELYRQAMQEQRAVSLEHRYVWPDGRDTWIDMRSYPVGDGLAVFYRDVTDRKRTEVALRESEERLRLALHAGQLAEVTFHLGDGSVSHSSTFAELLGHPSEKRLTLAELRAQYHPEDHDRVLAERAAILDGGQGFYEVEKRIVRPDGEVRWLYGRGSVNRDPLGNAVSVTAVYLDDTERKQTEMALRESEERLRAIVETATDYAIFTTDAEGLIETWPAGAQEVFGWTTEEAVGQPDRIIFTPEDRAQGVPAKERQVALATGQAPNVRWHMRKDGTRVFIEGIARPLRGENGTLTGFVKVGQDMTERRATEDALRASEARLSFLDRLGAETAVLADADAVLATTTRLLGEHLGVSICAYADMDEDQDGFTIRGDWAAPDSASIVGHYSLADFGRLAVANLGAGLPLVVNDTRRELAPEEAATFQGIGIAATICMPLVKEGRLTALMAIHNQVPRVWTSEELALLREVTARSWAHVERVGATAELRESEAQFRAFAQAVPNHVWAAGPDGSLYWFNDQVYAYCGEAAGSLDGTEWVRIVHPDDRPAASAAWAGTFEAGEVYETEFRIRRRDGAYRWFLVRAEPVLGGDGAILNWVGTNTDIHDRRHAELALSELNETLEQQVAERTADRDRMWRLSTDVMLVARFDGTINAINPAWMRLLGWPEDELLGRAFFEFVHPDDLEATLAEAGRLSDGLTTFRFENRYRARDGSYRWISWIAVPEEDLIHAVGRDITAEKERQAELDHAQDALRQSQKMEAMGQLTGGVAHDFNNLLTPIIGSLDRLVTRGVGSERERQLLTGALESAERAKTLVQRLLAFARRQPLQAVAVDITALVEGMAGLIGSTLGPTIEVRAELAGDLPPAKVDPNQIEMALLNLAVNARDAMPEGGRLTISAARESVRRGERPGLRQGHYVRLCVADTGTGMDAATRERAIEPFFSTKGVGRGTGLGLSMVHGLLAQLGGGLAIESELGQGTTVEMWLPISAEPVEDVMVMPAALPQARTRGCALLVDDEIHVRMSTADMLESMGFDVLEASSAEEALQLLHDGVAIDLLVTDHLMPGLSGADLARQARALRPELPVLIVSGFAEAEGLAADLATLAKPFRAAELADRVAALMSSSVP